MRKIQANSGGAGQSGLVAEVGEELVARFAEWARCRRVSGLYQTHRTGTPRRELLHVDDLASACLYLLEHFDGSNPVNVGTGIDHTASEIADMVANAVGYSGETRWDPTRPDGAPRKLLDVSVLREAGWQSKITLREGIESTVAWYRANAGAARK